MKAAFHIPTISEDANLGSLPVTTLKDGGVTDFDLFCEIGGLKILYAPSPYRWSSAEVSRLQADGHVALYFQQRDEAKVKAFERLTGIARVDESLPPARRVQQIMDLAATLTRTFYDYPLTSAMIAKAEEITASLVRCVDEEPHCVQVLGRLAEHDQYTYYHSARVAAYAIAIAIKIGEKNHARLQEIALGCLLHDLGKSKIDLAIINKSEPLTKREWAVMRKHPEYGIELLEDQRLSIVAHEIVLHHHERYDGKGYPHGLSRNEILAEVNIAAFCDVFDALTTTRPYQSARSKFEALDFIRFHLLDAFFEDPYKAMVDILKTKAS